MFLQGRTEDHLHLFPDQRLLKLEFFGLKEMKILINLNYDFEDVTDIVFYQPFS